MNTKLVQNYEFLEMLKLGFIKSKAGKYPDMIRVGKQAKSRKKTHYVSKYIYKQYLKNKCPDKTESWYNMMAEM